MELAISVLNGTSTDMTELRDEVVALLEETGQTNELAQMLFDDGIDDGELAARALSLALRLREHSG